MKNKKPNPKVSQLEYLINLRAINYNSKCWVYFSLKQKVIFIEFLRSFRRYENIGKKSVTISGLIDEVKSHLDKDAGWYKKKFGTKTGNTYSKEAIRGTIYLCIPIYLNITQHGRPKIITLTEQTQKFRKWVNQTSVMIKKSGKKITKHNWYWWIKRVKINFNDKPPPQKKKIKTKPTEKRVETPPKEG